MPRNLISSRTCAHHVRSGALVALLIGHSVAFAAGPAPAAQYRIDQPSRPLSESLRSIAGQTGVSVLFDPAAVSGRMSQAVSGQLSAVEAISRALDGTGLVAEVMGDGSIVVRPAAAPNPVSQTPAHDAQASHVASARTESSPAAPAVLLAQTDSPSATEAGPTPTSDVRGAPKQLTTVEVTGSRLKRIDGDGPAPVNTYTRADIEQSGQPTLERFLSSLNEASVSPGEGGFGATTGQGSVQLRGLPLGSTLVLINGRRIQAVGSSSADFFNLDLIPMAAVERIEIVPVGSSAVYGGDALAGVVNVILKKSIDGGAMDARLGTGKGIGDASVSLATGGRDADGSFLLLGSYSKSTPLTTAERDFFNDGDYRRFGGVDARTRSCTPGTVSSTTTANLPGLNSSFAGIPQTTSGQPLTISNFAATAGQANLCNPLANGNGTGLVYGKEDFALHATGERHFAGAWSVFGELSFTNDRLHAKESGLQLNDVVVPANNPYNPFGAPVQVTARLGLENGAEGIVRNTNFTRALAGLRADLGSGWDLEASLSITRDDGERRLTNNSVNAAALDAALGASTTAAALNPFTSGRAASGDVLGSIWSDSIRESHGRKEQGSAFVRGPLMELPAGKVDAIAGVEVAHDRYQTASPGLFDILDSRASRAVYGEIRVPLLRGTAPAGTGWDLAALTVAGRRDMYSDFGGANTYQAGVELRPVRTVLLRASAATSFKPPTLLETSVDDISFTSELFGLVDPTRAGAAIVGAQVLRATNPDLKPEKGRAYSFGAVWEPESASGTRLGVTAWRVRINGLISLLWPQVTLDNEALFPGFVTRAPSVGGVPGDVTRVLYSEVNFGSVETSGTDMEISHSWKASGGKWTVAGGATRTSKYDVAITPGAPVEHRLGRRALDFWAPKWKGRVSAALDEGAWSLGLTSRYLGAYRDMEPSDRKLGNFWFHDLTGTLDLKRLGLGFGSVSAAKLSLGIVNLANRLPEFVETFPYYDVTQGDWRGRYASLRLSVNW
jgi:iron complex outermembrane recepter protein